MVRWRWLSSPVALPAGGTVPRSEAEGNARDRGGIAVDDNQIAQTMGFNDDQQQAYDALDEEERAAFASAIGKSDGHSNLEAAVYNRVMGAGATGLPKAGMTTVEAFESQASMYTPMYDTSEGQEEQTEQQGED